ncbi:hypothetical protein K2X92_00780 [Candidatus Gracilibacteria bacterium]|nr:hypothetical protein [Candidatus Gracilibacteria bacterium]
MYSKKQHIARKTIITCLAFAGGMISTVLAAAVYDANVQSRANTIFDVIKKNASTMDQSDSTAYYNLVRLNIKSLVEVLTAVDGKILTELGSTLPGLDDIDIIGELTGTGNIGSGNTLSNSQIKLTAVFDGSSGDKAIFSANSAVTFSWVIPAGFTQCVGNGGNTEWATAMRNNISFKIPMNVVSVATPYSISCYDQNRKLVNSNLIGFGYDSVTNTMSIKRDYSCTIPGQLLQVAGNCTCPTDKAYVGEKSNTCVTQEEAKQELILVTCLKNGGKVGTDGLCGNKDSTTDSKQRIFIKFNRSLPSSEYSRAENECGIPLGKSSCTINIDWYSSADTKTMELFSSVAGAPYTLLQSALISSRTLILSPSTETKIRFTSNPGNQIDEIIFKGICTEGGKWNGTSCKSDTSVGGNDGIGNTADVDIVLHTPNGTNIEKGTELTFGMSAVFKNPKDTDTCNLSYSTSSGKSKLVDFRGGGRVSDNISRGRNPELWNEYIAAGGSRSVTIHFEDIEGYYPNNQSTVVFTCNNVRKEVIVTFKAKPIVTTLETNKSEAKIGDTVDVQYGVSADRTCSIYVVKSGNVLKKDISAGTSGMVTYLIKEGDNSTAGNLELEMSCSNGSKKSKDVKVLSSCQSGYIYSTTYSACTKPVKVTLNCNNTTTAAGWYKNYLGRCGENEGIDYWNSQILLTSESEQYNAFKYSADLSVGTKTKQEYLNGFLCDGGATYINNTTLCKI